MFGARPQCGVHPSGRFHSAETSPPSRGGLDGARWGDLGWSGWMGLSTFFCPLEIIILFVLGWTGPRVLMQCSRDIVDCGKSDVVAVLAIRTLRSRPVTAPGCEAITTHRVKPPCTRSQKKKCENTLRRRYISSHYILFIGPAVHKNQLTSCREAAL